MHDESREPLSGTVVFESRDLGRKCIAWRHPENAEVNPDRPWLRLSEWGDTLNWVSWYYIGQDAVSGVHVLRAPHLCHVPGCGTETPRELCGVHWRAVPWRERLRRRVKVAANALRDMAGVA